MLIINDLYFYFMLSIVIITLGALSYGIVHLFQLGLDKTLNFVFNLFDTQDMKK